MHQVFDIAVQLFAAIETLQTPVDDQVFPHGKLRVDGCKLRADSEGETGGARVVDHRDTVDEDVALVRNGIAACSHHQRRDSQSTIHRTYG